MYTHKAFYSSLFYVSMVELLDLAHLLVEVQGLGWHEGLAHWSGLVKVLV